MPFRQGTDGKYEGSGEKGKPWIKSNLQTPYDYPSRQYTGNETDQTPQVFL